MEKYNSRKFCLCIGCILIICIALAAKLIDQAVFSNLLMFIIGQYSVANLFDRKEQPVNDTKANLPTQN